jgi:hypothetical protein
MIEVEVIDGIEKEVFSVEDFYIWLKHNTSINSSGDEMAEPVTINLFFDTAEEFAAFIEYGVLKGHKPKFLGSLFTYVGNRESYEYIAGC